MLNLSVPQTLALANSAINPHTSSLDAGDTILVPRKCSSEQAREIWSPGRRTRSFRRFDTVTGNKVRSCKQMRGLLPSCYMSVTGYHRASIAEREQLLG